MHVPRLLIILLLLLFSEQKASSVPIFPKILWAYWNDPIESAPLLVRLCADLMRHYTDLNHWELRIVS